MNKLKQWWVKHKWYGDFPLRTWWKARKYWARPKMHFYFGRLQQKVWSNGCEKYNIKPGYIYTEYQNAFIPFVSTEYLKWDNPIGIKVRSWDVCWKDKYNTPRYEHPGYFAIFFGKNMKTAWEFAIWFTAPRIKSSCCPDDASDDYKKYHQYVNADDYWETMLSYVYYDDKDFSKTYQRFNGSYWESNDNGKKIKWPVLNPDFLTERGKAAYSHLRVCDTLQEFINNCDDDKRKELGIADNAEKIIEDAKNI